MNTRTFLFTALTALALVSTGCAFFQKIVGDNPDSVRANVKDAVSIGAQIALQENPGSRQKFELAYYDIDKVIVDGTVTGGTIVKILQSLPVKELQSPNATLYFQAGALLFNRIAGTQLDVTKNAYVLATAQGIRDGLKSALGL